VIGKSLRGAYGSGGGTNEKGSAVVEKKARFARVKRVMPQKRLLLGAEH